MEGELYNHVNQQVDAIRQRLAIQQRVEFVFHPWMDFPNLSTGGFKFKSVRQAVIPSLTAIPIVAYQDVLYDSKMSTVMNKYVPHAFKFEQDIESALIDLLGRFQIFGMIHLKPLSTDIDNIDTSVKVFEILVEPLRSLPMQEALRYLGAVSPVESQLTLRKNRVKEVPTAMDVLREADLTAEEFNLGTATIPLLITGYERAQRKAIMPPTGILPSSINSMNKGRKFKFDEADEWIQTQFPAFDAASRFKNQVPQGDGNTDLSELVTAFKTIVEKAVGTQAAEQVVREVQQAVPAVAPARVEEPEDELEIPPYEEEVGEPEPEPVPSTGKRTSILELEEALEDSLTASSVKEEIEEFSDSELFDLEDPFEDDGIEVLPSGLYLCKGLTLKGTKCKGIALENGYCHAHQEQV